jgi:hypothetical protein
MGRDDQQPDDEHREQRLVGWAGDEVSGGISTSSTGGAPVGEEAEGGLDEIVRHADLTGWGQPQRGSDRLDDEREGDEGET